MTRRVNYLNNKDILKEIHKSKTTYCTYLSPEFSDYDIIVPSSDNIVPNLEAGKIARAERLTKLAQDKAVETEGKKKSEVPEILPESIKNEEVIFRVMTWSHIPEAAIVISKTAKGKKIKISTIDEDAEKLITEYDEELPEVVAPSPKFVKVNFPPFHHYRVVNEEVELIGKSHWKGDLTTGSYSRDHGRVSKNLAQMYMKLVERYATRSNWRGYTYNDEMQSQALLQLSQIGLQFDEAKSSNPFSYYTAVIQNSFTRVLNIEKQNQNIRDDIMEMNNLNPSYTRQGMGGGFQGSDGGMDD